VKLGYERVSTADQDPQGQLRALENAGCDQIWTGQASGVATARPELTDLLMRARAGDVLVVWRLDRIGRSLQHLIQFTQDVDERGIQFHSLTEGIDTTTASGELLFNSMGSLAQFEHALIKERTQAGLAAARAKGRIGGRPSALTPQVRAAIIDLRDKGKNIGEIASTLQISKASVYHALS
jgi:DNA invertase Pin-like site-specific DNA recombinase